MKREPGETSRLKLQSEKSSQHPGQQNRPWEIKSALGRMNLKSSPRLQQGRKEGGKNVSVFLKTSGKMIHVEDKERK